MCKQYTLLRKVRVVSYGFSSSHLWMLELDHKEGWALKNRCFQTVAELRRLLRVPWTVRRSNQSIRKEINSEYSSEGLMLKLKLQYFGHLMWRANSLQKTLMLGKSHYPGGSERQWNLVCCSPWGCKELDTTERLNWTELIKSVIKKYFFSKT